MSEVVLSSEMTPKRALKNTVFEGFVTEIPGRKVKSFKLSVKERETFHQFLIENTNKNNRGRLVSPAFFKQRYLP